MSSNQTQQHESTKTLHLTLTVLMPLSGVNGVSQKVSVPLDVELSDPEEGYKNDIDSILHRAGLVFVH